MAQAQFTRETGNDGSWVRQQSAFRDVITADGSSGIKAEPGRFHLYVSAACPWAHRAMIFRAVKGLEEAIAMTVVDPLRDERGWRFGAGDQRTGDVDPLHGWTYLAEGYRATEPAFEGRVTVPVIWDTREQRVVNNESSDVIRMLDGAFDEWAAHPERRFRPAGMEQHIDEVNGWVYANVNNGVYRCGFATTQDAYETAFANLFSSLDRLERILETSRYVAGDVLTEADWRLFTTLLRFDPVYHGHFKCNLRRIADYPLLWALTRELYQYPGVAATVDMDHIKRHYYVTHDQINPTGIVPLGPDISGLEELHGRG